MRWLALAAVGTAAALALGTTAQAVAQDGVATAASVLPGLSAAEMDGGATAAGVSAAVAPLLSGGALGSQVGALVADGATGEVLYAQGETTARVPASTTKILTAAATLGQFGPDHVLRTRVVLQGDSQVVIVGAGDPSLRADRDDPGIGATLENLAQLTAVALREQQPADAVSVAVDVSLFSGPELATGWGDGDVATCYVRPVVALMTTVPPAGACRPGTPPEFAAATDFAAYLSAAGVTVADTPPQRVTTTGQDPLLAEVVSPPMAAIVEQMMLDSDNTGAEMLAHLLGGAALGDASFSGGARATSEALTAWGVPTEGMLLDDGSGMSEDNRIAPATIAGVLRTATAPEHIGELWAVSAGLPAAGFDGTLALRFGADSADGGRGDVRAKTGTLLGVSALAGQVVTESGQLLHFVFLADDTGPTAAARAQLDQAAAALAECGCTSP